MDQITIADQKKRKPNYSQEQINERLERAGAKNKFNWNDPLPCVICQIIHNGLIKMESEYGELDTEGYK